MLQSSGILVGINVRHKIDAKIAVIENAADTPRYKRIIATMNVKMLMRNSVLTTTCKYPSDCTLRRAHKIPRPQIKAARVERGIILQLNENL